jgi:2-isopropylmalate synthase
VLGTIRIAVQLDERSFQQESSHGQIQAAQFSRYRCHSLMEKLMKLIKHVSIFDTTLRDGEQAPGYSLTTGQKVGIAEACERLGVNTIEVGFPASSPDDFESARQICKALNRAVPCGFARTVAADIDACAESMQSAANPRIQLASVGSDIHIKYKRGITRQQVVQETVDAIDHAKHVGFRDISLLLEDATRSDLLFMKQLIGAGIEHGIMSIVVPDTVGYCLPGEYYALVKELRDFVGEDIQISAHCHNDLGLAVANSIAGIEAGADEVQATLCGIGERAGNASMEEIVAILCHKGEHLHRTHDIVQHRLHETCSLVASHLNLNIPLHKPIIGRNAFSTEAGMHQQGIMKYRFTYEFMRAADFGAESRMIIGRHSGRNILRQNLASAGIKEIDSTVLDRVYAAIMSDGHADRYNDPKLLMEQYRLQESIGIPAGGQAGTHAN